MDDKLRSRMACVEEAAACDPCYQQLLRENRLLEKRFDQMVRCLSDEGRAIAWDYVMNCEDMSRRMLELACRK